MTSKERAQKYHTDDVSLPWSRSGFDWSRLVGNVLQPIRSSTQIWVATRQQYGSSALASQTSLRGNTIIGSVEKCRLLSQARLKYFVFKTTPQQVVTQEQWEEQMIAIGSFA